MQHSIDEGAFARSRSQLDHIVAFLDGDGAGALSHGELEDSLGAQGRELLRLLYQDHLDLRAEREPRLDAVVDAEGTGRPRWRRPGWPGGRPPGVTQSGAPLAAMKPGWGCAAMKPGRDGREDASVRWGDVGAGWMPQ